MDAGVDSDILLDGNTAGGGNGRIDMLLYVPDALFQGTSHGTNPFIYLYSRASNEGGSFEEFSFSEEGGIPGAPGIIFTSSSLPPLPEPSTISLVALGIYFCRGRRKRKPSPNQR